MPVSVAVVTIIAIVIATVIAVVVMIPFVIMLYAAAPSVPIAGIKAFPVVAWSDPTCALIGWPGPVTFVPAVVSTRGIPVTANKDKLGPRLSGQHCNYPRLRWCTDADPDRDLSICGIRAGKQQCE